MIDTSEDEFVESFERIAVEPAEDRTGQKTPGDEMWRYREDGLVDEIIRVRVVRAMSAEELAAIEKRAEVLRRRGEPDQEQVFALIAAVQLAWAVLRAVEWSFGAEHDRCPTCFGARDAGHMQGCALAAALGRK